MLSVYELIEFEPTVLSVYELIDYEPSVLSVYELIVMGGGGSKVWL